MGRSARLRRKLRRAEHFATVAAGAAALAGNAKYGARLAPTQRGRMGASPAAVNAGRGAECSPAERRAGAPHVAENAAATGAVAHAIQEGTFVMVLISGEAQSSPEAWFTSSARWRCQSRSRRPRAHRQPLASAGNAARSSRSHRGGSRRSRSTDTGRCGVTRATPSAWRRPSRSRQQKRRDCHPWGGRRPRPRRPSRGGGRRAGGLPGRGAPGRTAQGGRGRGGASYCCCAGRGCRRRAPRGRAARGERRPEHAAPRPIHCSWRYGGVAGWPRPRRTRGPVHDARHGGPWRGRCAS